MPSGTAYGGMLSPELLDDSEDTSSAGLSGVLLSVDVGELSNSTWDLWLVGEVGVPAPVHRRCGVVLYHVVREGVPSSLRILMNFSPLDSATTLSTAVEGKASRMAMLVLIGATCALT